MEIGVLALQGAVREHLNSLAACGVTAKPVKTLIELDGLNGLIVPGGESTTVGKLLVRYGMLEPIKLKAREGMAVFGTCTGLIMLAREINGYDQPCLGLMDISVKRNAFGRQINSFETDLSIPVLGVEPLRAVFIRSPEVTTAGPDTEILARYEEHIVLVRQGCFLAAAFHPELTPDTRLHRYFLQECCRSGSDAALDNRGHRCGNLAITYQKRAASRSDYRFKEGG